LAHLAAETPTFGRRRTLRWCHDQTRRALWPPGTILADRYRIVRLLGRWGMGVVYQAEDLRLGHPVALKFLPAALATDSRRLSQFHNEVSLARQVSHPNVCRVYDIGDVDGHLFLSMSRATCTRSA
jgi:serine/threonine protein kinase